MHNQNSYIADCYKLPWNETDNPNGWIEPTSFCNLSCPGCYRGCDKPDHQPHHLPLNEVKKQIDWFSSNRNVHTISIAGGEPLLYPEIFELIKYASSLHLRTMMYTNGLLLNSETAKKLANAGLTQIVVHVDRFQIRPDIKDHETHSDLREKFVSILRHVPQLKLGFIQPLSAHCNDELFEVMNFLNKNIDIVNLMVFTLYRNICWQKSVSDLIDDNISMQKAVDQINLNHGFVPAAWLPTENDNQKPAWVFAQKAGIANYPLGHFSSPFYRLVHEKYRKKHGRYLFISRKNHIKVIRLLPFLWIKCIRQILFEYVKLRMQRKIKNNEPIYFQTTLIISPPEISGSKRNLCKGCPDRMIYNGKLVPSCILEELKKNSILDFETAYKSNILA